MPKPRPFSRGEKLSATRLNEAFDMVSRPPNGDGLIEQENGGLRLNVERLLARLPLALYLYQATADAETDPESGVMTITAKRVNSDGTLVDPEKTFIIVPETPEE